MDKNESSDSDNEEIDMCYAREDDGIRACDNGTGDWVRGRGK